MTIQVAMHEYTNLMYAFNSDRTTSNDTGVGIRNTKRDKSGQSDFFSYQFEKSISLYLAMYFALGAARYAMKNPEAEERRFLDKMQLLHKLIVIYEILHVAWVANILGLPSGQLLAQVIGYGASLNVILQSMLGGAFSAALYGAVQNIAKMPVATKLLFQVLTSLITQLPIDEAFTNEELQSITKGIINEFVTANNKILGSSKTAQIELKKRAGIELSDADEQFLLGVAAFNETYGGLNQNYEDSGLVRQRSGDLQIEDSNKDNLQINDYNPDDDAEFEYGEISDGDIDYNEPNFFGEKEN
jgi:hypothetical protein